MNLRDNVRENLRCHKLLEKLILTLLSLNHEYKVLMSTFNDQSMGIGKVRKLGISLVISDIT